MSRSRKLVAAGAVAGLLGAGVVTGPGATAQEPPQQAGEPSLRNLEHVFNFETQGAYNRIASDLEFYTPTVPLRDRDSGEKILDEEGNEILVERDFAVMGSYDGGAWVFDITDPEAPFFAVNIPCYQRQNDVQIKQFGDRWVLALAKDQSGNPCGPGPHKGQTGAAGISVWDITDPYEYSAMYTFRTASGAHNFTFHPTEPYGWVSTGDIGTGLSHIPIIDFSDLENPVLAADPQTIGSPHDIAFSVDGSRAYVAAENNWEIYDTTDPENPVLLNAHLPNAGTYAHGFDPTPDGRYAIGTNESLALGGFFLGGSAVCPGEGLTIFDVEDESRPVPVGQFFAPIAGNPSERRDCTGHVGEVAPNGRTMVTGWYAGGARVIDFSDPSLPTEVGHAVMPGAEVWAAKIHQGPYLYTADTRRGFDVFEWTGDGPAPWEAEAG